MQLLFNPANKLVPLGGTDTRLDGFPQPDFIRENDASCERPAKRAASTWRGLKSTPGPAMEREIDSIFRSPPRAQFVLPVFAMERRRHSEAASFRHSFPALDYT